MDIGNLNKVYSIVSSAGNQQILNVSGDQKVLSLADGSSQLSPKQIEDNRTFHLGLLNSLTAITNDQAVLAEVRTKLGLPEKGENLEPKSIFARDIKAAIDLVMANVSKRIGEVLTRPFPDAVNKLILEAVKANPKHDVVKAFLANEGGTLDNLARLCRLTCQSLTDGANSAALAYLDGFAYDVADFVNVLKVSVSDNQQYEAGVNHRTEEEKAKTEKKTKPTEIKNTQLLRMDSTMEEDEVNEELLTNIFSKKTEMHGKNTKKQIDKNVQSQIGKKTKPTEIKKGQSRDKIWSSLEEIKEEEEEYIDGQSLLEVKPIIKGKKVDNAQSKNDVAKNNENKSNDVKNEKNNDNNVKVDEKSNVKVSVDEGKVDPTVSSICQALVGDDNHCFKKALIKDENKYFSDCINRFLKDSCKGDNKLAEKYVNGLVDAINDLLPYKEYLGEPVKLLEEAMFRAKAAVRRPEVFVEAVNLCSDEIRKLEDAIKNPNTSKLHQKPLDDFLLLVRDPLKNTNSELYDTTSRAYTCSMRTLKAENEVAKDVAKVIKDAITNALDNKDLRKPQDVVLTNPNVQQGPYGKDTLLTQGNTNMCYLRSLENALLAKGKSLPEPDKGTYTFNVAFANGGNAKGERMTFTRQITVNNDEIKALKQWYKTLGIDPGNDLTELDWAVNIAQAKKTAVQNIMNKAGGDEEQKVKAATVFELKELTNEMISSAKEEGKYNMAEQNITKSGFDSAVAALFGLTSEPVSISVNHNGYVQGGNQTLGQYLQSEGKEPDRTTLYEKFNEVRNWKKANPDGIMTLNEAGKHFVAVTGFYFNNDDDFGFIVRDSNKAENIELPVNVVHYVYDGKLGEKFCQKLDVHCYAAPQEVKN